MTRLNNQIYTAVLNHFTGREDYTPASPVLSLVDNTSTAITDDGSPVSGTAQFNPPTAADPAVASLSAAVSLGTVNADWSSVSVSAIHADSGSTSIFEEPAASTISIGDTLSVSAANISFGTNTNTASTTAFLQDVCRLITGSSVTAGSLRFLGLALNGTELTGGSYARVDLQGTWSAPVAATSSVSITTASPVSFTANADFSALTFNQYVIGSALSSTPLITISSSTQTITAGQAVTVRPTITLQG